MIGMHARTATRIDGDAHLAQSVADILTTPIGTRIMRRDYGSLLPDLIDAPYNGSTRMRMYGAIATALMRWEPRLRLTRIALTPADPPGVFALDIEGYRTDTPTHHAHTRLSIPLRLTT